jgi:DNA repair photolyase
MMQSFTDDDFGRPVARAGLIDSLIDEAPWYAGTDKRVLLCFTCDAYQPLDDKEQLTRSVIKVLKKNDIHFQILTKGGLSATRDFDLYQDGDAFATTLTYTDENESGAKEPGAALPAERIEAIRIAHERKIETWVSLEPVMDIEQSLEIIRMTHEFVDLYKIGKLNHFYSEIDWRKFGIKAIDLCHKLKKSYYVKNDLAESLKGVEFTNIDTRRVKRN